MLAGAHTLKLCPSMLYRRNHNDSSMHLSHCKKTLQLQSTLDWMWSLKHAVEDNRKNTD